MKRILVYLLGIIIFLSCASPQKSFKKGDYEKAYTSALKSLKKGEKDRKLKTILNNSFDELYRQHLDKAEKLIASGYIEDWEEAYLHMNKVIVFYVEGSAYLDNEIDESIRVLKADSDSLKTDLAQGYYDLADEKIKAFESNNDKNLARESHQFYLKSLEYGYDDKDIADQVDYAYQGAVIVLNVIAEAPYERSFGWEIDRRFDDLENESENYLEVVYDNRNVRADCNMEIQFSNFRRNLDENYSTRSFSERVEDGYETQVDTSGKTTRVQKYATVTGEVTITSEEYTFEWGAYARTYGDNRYCDFPDRRFDERERRTNERYQVRGDRRAIPNQYLNDRVENINEERIAEEMIDDIYNQVRRYYFN